MTEELIIEIMQMTLQTAAMMVAPVIVTVVIIGLLSQIVQTVTQLKDNSLTFVPKVVCAGIVFTLAIPWYIQLVQRYCEIVFTLIGKGAM